MLLLNMLHEDNIKPFLSGKHLLRVILSACSSHQQAIDTALKVENLNSLSILVAKSVNIGTVSFSTLAAVRRLQHHAPPTQHMFERGQYRGDPEIERHDVQAAMLP